MPKKQMLRTLYSVLFYEKIHSDAFYRWNSLKIKKPLISQIGYSQSPQFIPFNKTCRQEDMLNPAAVYLI